jgi:zinc protease
MKAAAALVVFALATAVGAQAPPQSPPQLQVKYTQFTLPNGLHVIIHEDHSVPIVTVNTWYHVGSAREHTGIRDDYRRYPRTHGTGSPPV